MSSLTHQLQLWYDWPINTLQDVAFVNPEQCPFCSHHLVLLGDCSAAGKEPWETGNISVCVG